MSFIVKKQFKVNNEVSLSIFSALLKRKSYYEYKDTHLFNNITTIEFFMCFNLKTIRAYKNVLKKQSEMRLIVLSLYYIWVYNIN